MFTMLFRYVALIVRSAQVPEIETKIPKNYDIYSINHVLENFN